MKKILIAVWVVVCAVPGFAVDVTIGTGGRVSLELIGSEAAFRNTLSIASPSVSVAVSGCKLEPAVGLGGVHILSEKTSQRGCRVDLDSDAATAGIQPFPNGTTFELRMCAQTDADVDCEFVWSSNPASNADGVDHVRTTTIDPGKVFRLNWEDLSGGGDNDFNDLIAIFRVASDADGDALWDDWETTGIDTDGNGTIDLDLPSLGANPQRKNIFVEIDWMDCTVAGSDCAAGDTHNHRPLAAAVTAVVDAFAAANVANPDGSTGITLRLEVGNSIAHQNLLNIPGLCFNGGAGIGSFDLVKVDPANFGSASPRRFAYRYGLFTHQQVAGNTTSGCGELPGNDFQVSLGAWNYICNGGTRNGLGCANNDANCPGGGVCQAGDVDGDGSTDQDTGTVAQQAGTLMHELGHTLNLQHGGGDSVNWKPNYLSVMNYWFQMGWIPPTPRLDYSRAALLPLIESNLDEGSGISDGTDNTAYYCPDGSSRAGDGDAAVDWNCDGDLTGTGITADINFDRVCTSAGPNGNLDTTAGGDDVVSGTQVWDGPNRQCETTAGGDDRQVRLGDFQPAGLPGYEDWPNLLYDFRTTTSYEDGDHVPVVPLQELTFEEWFEVAAPDVSLDISASASTIVTGTNVTFTITLRNSGPAEARNVVVTDLLPSSLTFVSCAASGGGVCGGSGNHRTVSFTALPGGEQIVATLVATLNCSLSDGAPVVNAAAASAAVDSDPSNNADQVIINASNPPPQITNVAVSKTQLWPANHKMVDVVVSYDVSDTCPFTRTLSVASNEPVNGTGDGDTAPDWEVVDANKVRLRAERAATGTGRTYTITMTVTDSGGASSTATTSVTVPIAQR